MIRSRTMPPHLSRLRVKCHVAGVLLVLLAGVAFPGGLPAAAPEEAARAGTLKPPPVQSPAESSSHPVIHEWQKEAFNFWAELKTGLQQKAYQDVAQLIYSAGADARRGLLADLRDPQLLVPYATLIDSVMRDDPQARAVLVQQFSQVAALRLQAAIADADYEALETLAVQFSGTRIAADALRWLGDRELVRGRFAEALAYYGRAGQHADAAQQPDLGARLRLAGAFLGRSVGQRVQAPVELGDERLEAPKFEALVVRLLKNRTPAPAADAAGGVGYSEVAAALAPGPLSAQPWPRDADRDAGNRRPWDRWEGNTPMIAAVADGRCVVLGDGRRLDALELESGRRLWSRDIGDSRPCPPQWKEIPLRPLIAAGRVYSRCWSDKGLELNCLDMAHGQPVWSSLPQQFVVTDPLWDGSRVLAVTATVEEIPQPRRGGRPPAQMLWRYRFIKMTMPWQLQLTAFEPGTGKVLEQRPLVRLQTKEQGIPVCRAALADELLVLAVPGGVLLADRTGKLRWLRRQPWLPNAPQPHEPALPIVAQGQVFLVPSQAATAQALDLVSGRLQWECQTSSAARLLGVVGRQLIARDGPGLLALDLASGRIAWRRELETPLQGFFCGSGQLAYTACRRDHAGRWCAAIVWLDATTGSPTAEYLIDGIKPAKQFPRNTLLGPVLPVGKRLFVVYRDVNQGRRGLLELFPEAANQETAGLAAGAARGAGL